MEIKLFKPVYQAPRTTRILIRTEVNLCASNTMSATVENMDETDYGWEI